MGKKIIIEIRISEYGKPGSITMPLYVEEQSFNDIWVALSHWMREHDERLPGWVPVPKQVEP